MIYAITPKPKKHYPAPMLKLLASNVKISAIPFVELATDELDPHSTSEELESYHIAQILQAANASELKYSYHDSMRVPHSPVWIHFSSDFDPHKDCGGLAIIYVAQGQGLLRVRVKNSLTELRIKAGDVVLFDDRMLHSYIAESASMQCAMFNVEALP